MSYWLMKSEPSVYGIDHLKRDRRSPWDGVRNYQVRNMMRDDMHKGDLAFFYHSSCAEPGIVGLMTIAGTGRADPSQFDRASKYYDPKSSPEAPRWLLVDVVFKKKFERTITLTELRKQKALAGMLLLQRGSRLSVTPVTAVQWNCIMRLAGS